MASVKSKMGSERYADRDTDRDRAREKKCE